MSALDRNKRWNPGGGHQLELIEATSVTGYSRPTRSAVPTFTLLDGRSFSSIYCTPGTLEYSLEHTETDNGDLYTIEIRGFHPGDDAAREEALSSFLGGKRLMARFTDYAGQSRLAGTPVEYLSLTHKFGTGADVPDSRGYNFSLKGTLTLPPAYE